MSAEIDSIQGEQKLGASLAILRRRHRQFLIPLIVLTLVTVVVAFAWPPVFRSTATILIEQQEIPVALIPTTVTSFADERLHVIGQRVMTSANLLGIVQKFNLYPDDADEPPEVLVDLLRDDIAVEPVSADVVDPRNGRPTQATIAFTVSYEHESPELAYRVASELTSLYLNENLKSRNQTVTDTSEFLSQEAARLGREVEELGQKLSAFKETNITKLPELTDLNLRFLDRIEHDRAQAEEEIRANDQRRVYLQAMLAGLAQNVPLPNSAQQLMTPAERRQVLESSLVSMAAIYGADHPDVVRAKRELAALQSESPGVAPSPLADELAAREAELADARLQYSPDHPDVQRLERTVAELRAANEATGGAQAAAELPRGDAAYVQLYGQLQAANAERTALAEKKKDIETQYAELQKRLEDSPRIESEYRGLMREYDATSTQYQEIKGKLSAAQLAESLEAGRKGERFTVIDPATRPEEPVRPNRVALLFLGILVALACAIGFVATSEALDESVRGFAAATALVGQAPLAVIPVITTAAEAATHRLRLRLIAGGATASAAIAALLVHVLVMPLDTVWLLALKRFGL